MTLVTKNLQFSYNEGVKMIFPDINVPSQGSLLVMGKSGVGKTTFLHLLGGLLEPSSGSVKIAGTDLYSLKEAKRDVFRAQHIGIVFQQAHLFAALTLIQNLELTAHLAKKKDLLSIKELLGSLDLMHRLDAKPSQLSVGEQQRASLARALLVKPQLILADEPTSALDDENCKKTIELLQVQAQKHGAALVVVTHDSRLKNQFSEAIVL